MPRKRVLAVAQLCSSLAVTPARRIEGGINPTPTHACRTGSASGKKPKFKPCLRLSPEKLFTFLMDTPAIDGFASMRGDEGSGVITGRAIDMGLGQLTDHETDCKIGAN